MTRRRMSLAVLILLGGMTVMRLLAQPPGPAGPPRRAHRVTQARQLQLLPVTEQPRQKNEVLIEVRGDERVIRCNGIPAHNTGRFPNGGNPHSIAAQSYSFRIPARPEPAERITPLGMQDFGIAVNGVPFDPGAAEWYLGDRAGGWRYEPLSGAIDLGIDASHAHVQPNGAYHYHGLPTPLLESIQLDATRHSPLVGWAADGFPIYAMFGYEDPKDDHSGIKLLRSSFQLKKGARPTGDRQPGGEFDGTFIADYEFVDGSGDLDECNGRYGVTPDFGEGTYAYFLTENWPVIPRNFRGTPSADFARRGPPGGPGGRGPGGRRPRPDGL